jgi:hypothetical protein
MASASGSRKLIPIAVDWSQVNVDFDLLRLANCFGRAGALFGRLLDRASERSPGLFALHLPESEEPLSHFLDLFHLVAPAALSISVRVGISQTLPRFPAFAAKVFSPSFSLVSL